VIARASASILLAALGWPAPPARAQDRRHVIEPRPICRSLVGNAAPVRPDTDDPPLDTGRIQEALDACQAGMGVVQDVSYRDVCIRRVRNPIVVDSFYDRVTTGPLVPVFERVLLQDVRVTGGGTVTIAGADDEHRPDLTFDGLVFDAVAPTVHTSHARLVFGPGIVNLSAGGPDVLVTPMPGSRAVPSCEGRFLAFSEQE
jgi:hypothetical protein